MDDISTLLIIDKNNLDEEWRNQPLLAWKYTEIYAQAILERDQAKAHLELVSASLFKDITQDPTSFGVKGTDAAAKNAVLEQPDYVVALDDFNQKNKNMNVLRGAVDAIAQRRSALENITKLFLSNYYAEPYISDKAKTAYSEKEATEEINKLLGENERLRKKADD
jgi:hypothetical protein